MAIRALLCHGATGRDTEMCSFPAMVRQPAHSAFTYVTLFRDLRPPLLHVDSNSLDLMRRL